MHGLNPSNPYQQYTEMRCQPALAPYISRVYKAMPKSLGQTNAASTQLCHEVISNLIQFISEADNGDLKSFQILYLLCRHVYQNYLETGNKIEYDRLIRGLDEEFLATSPTALFLKCGFYSAWTITARSESEIIILMDAAVRHSTSKPCYAALESARCLMNFNLHKRNRHIESNIESNIESYYFNIANEYQTHLIRLENALRAHGRPNPNQEFFDTFHRLL